MPEKKQEETPHIQRKLVIQRSINKLRSKVPGITGNRPDRENLGEIIQEFDLSVGLRPLHRNLLEEGKVSLALKKEDAREKYAAAFKEFVSDIEDDLKEALSKYMVEHYWEREQPRPGEVETEEFEDLEKVSHPDGIVPLPPNAKKGLIDDMLKQLNMLRAKEKTPEGEPKEGPEETFYPPVEKETPLPEETQEPLQEPRVRLRLDKSEQLRLATARLDVILNSIQEWTKKLEEGGGEPTLPALKEKLESIAGEENLKKLHEAFLRFGTVTLGADRERLRNQYEATLRIASPKIEEGARLAISEYMAGKYGKEA